MDVHMSKIMYQVWADDEHARLKKDFCMRQ